MVRGIRGAVTVEADNGDDVLDATEELIGEMIERNELEPERVAQVLITVTEDLVSAFPAKALRRFKGWAYVPVTCAREIPVPGSLPRCIRILMTVNTSIAQQDIRHIYLREAKQLRPDLALTREK